jgi:hypothetical protein
VHLWCLGISRHHLEVAVIIMIERKHVVSAVCVALHGY